MKARYFKSVEDVGFLNPIERFLANIFGKEILVIKCKDCEQIPTELIGGYCWDCLLKTKMKNENN